MSSAPSRIETLTALLGQHPEDPTIHYMLGHEYSKAQRFAEAIAALRRYLELAADEGAAYRLLAHCCERLGMLDDARQAYRAGLEVAARHNHQPMIDEYTEALKNLA
jgi:Flp pilus assembly protein TadD